MVLDDGPAKDRHAVGLVQQLKPRVETEDGRHDRQREIAGEWGVDVGADEVGEPQQRDVDVGPAAPEPADVALDLDRVLGIAGSRQRSRNGTATIRRWSCGTCTTSTAVTTLIATAT